ncbi:MAG: flavoprotein [Cytophagaceae bacterium SCN 52-12]|nr:MAG: flavoprotein [Cytophagaceae bacterium SCN 52-12]
MHIVIIGGGAAGFMAAITAAESFPGSKVTVLEKSGKVLSKVRISGGGRCNVTHQPSSANHFAKNYPRGEKFLKSILSVFSADDTVSWFESRGARLKTEPDGRMFPVTDSSDTIIHCLMENARKKGVEVRTGIGVHSFEKTGDQFQLEIRNESRNNELRSSDASRIMADRVIIATGGAPKLQGFDWLAEHRHPIIHPVPSLFTFNTPESYLLPLAGVSVQHAKVSIPNTSLKSEGPLLITHWGFSGPAILRLSAWGARELAGSDYRFMVRINWTGGSHFDQVRETLYGLKSSFPKQQLAAHAQYNLPARLWRLLAEKAGITGELRLADTPHKSLNKLAMLLTDGTFDVSGKTTFKEEFVTCGGVSLECIDPKTMESRNVKGLFFAGEVIDVDGITGGFNFQNAWSTGFIAGKHAGLEEIAG